MPNPKRRHSKARTGNRRAHDSLKGHSLSKWPNWHEKKMPHRACPKCGYYKGREVLEVKETSEKSTRHSMPGVKALEAKGSELAPRPENESAMQTARH